MRNFKNIGKEKLKNNRGSITTLVAITIFTFVVILTGTYTTIMILRQSQAESNIRIKNVYGKDVDRVDEVYDELKETLSPNSWNDEKNVNKPQLLEGMTPVKFTLPTNENIGTIVSTTENDADWYEYGTTSTANSTTKRWANAQTKDGSMWVWIPRFAYKITYYANNNKTTVSEEKTMYGKIDVVFLKNNTNLDENGNDVTSKSYVDKDGVTGEYIVHPAFKDGTKNGFANGEWDEEITGFWMAKFEAGYAGTAGNLESAVDSNVKYSVLMGWTTNGHMNVSNYYYGTREVEKTAIKYPVFQGNKPSMNYIGISDAYDLCLNLNAKDNPYGFTNKVDSHLTKNSEWGAVIYLSYSKYGTNGQKINNNNVSVAGENTVYAITGYGTSGGVAIDKSRDLETLMQEGRSESWTNTRTAKYYWKYIWYI